MLVHMTVPCCDFTEVAYRGGTQGGGLIARGATGRWCVVMYAGPEWVKQYIASGGTALSIEEAYQWVSKQGDGDYADYADF